MKLLIIFLIFFAIGLVLISPVLINIVKAKKMGFWLSFNEAMGLTFRKSFNNNLIEAYSLSRSNKLGITLIDLEVHMLANGNPLKSIQSLLYAKEKNVQISWEEITIADLTDKDVFKIIDTASEIFKVKINNIVHRSSNNKQLKVVYQGEFNVSYKAAFFDTLNKSKIEKEILPVISKYLDYSTNEDLVSSSKIIVETIINVRFWESRGLSLISQSLTIHPV